MLRKNTRHFKGKLTVKSLEKTPHLTLIILDFEWAADELKMRRSCLAKLTIISFQFSANVNANTNLLYFFILSYNRSASKIGNLRFILLAKKDNLMLLQGSSINLNAQHVNGMTLFV